MSDVDVRWRGKKVIEDESHRLVTDTQIDYWDKKSDSDHKHSKSDITDFPTSMPASDVKDWAKADKKPTYTWDEITGKPTSPAAHTHRKTDIVDFPDSLKNPSSITVMLNGGTDEGETCFTYDGSKTVNINITASNIGASLSSHLHDDRYYTKKDIDTKISDSSEGIFSNITWDVIKNKPTEFNPINHTHTKAEIKDFPASLKNPNNIVIKLNSGTTEAKDQFTYDGSSMKMVDITPSSIGASAIGHNHTKSDIKDFPTSMPASDVYAWAKEKTKPNYTWSEIGGKPGEYTPGAHTHRKVDITDFPDSLKNPLELIIHLNGGTEPDVDHFIYDGSTKKSINITPALIGASPVGHTHDDRYYTEYEMDTKLNTKSDVGHIHDDRYYTETEMDTKLKNISDTLSSHTHDDRYYTETEMDTKLKNISDTLTAHNHVKLQGVGATSAVPGKSDDGFLTYHYNVNNGLANNMPSTNNANAILTISRHGGDYTTQLGFSSNDNIYYRNGVGSTAWKRLLDSANFNDYAPTKTGGGASGKWNISISGKADTAGTADKANAVDWGSINGKPSTYPATSHTHTKSEITDFPDSIKNPNNIVIKLNGGTTEDNNQFTYNGSVAKTINITPAGIGAATSGHNHDNAYSKLGHTHDERYYTESEIDTKLNGKANSSHTHPISDITNLQTTLDGKAASGHNHDSVYSKLGHTHDERYYTESEIDTKLGNINSSLGSHKHVKADITDFPDSLKNPKKLNIYLTNPGNATSSTHVYDGSEELTLDVATGSHNHDLSYSKLEHTHTIANITNLQSTLDGKAASSHIHDDRYYTEREIDDKLSIINNTLGSHKHVKADITDFPDSIKNPNSLSIQLNSGTATVYDGSSALSINITPAGIGAAESSHTHAIADITNLQTILNGKASSSHSHAWASITGDTKPSINRAKRSTGYYTKISDDCEVEGDLTVGEDFYVNTYYHIQGDSSASNTINIKIPAKSGTLALTSDLDGKANSSHKHSASDINVDIFGASDTISLGNNLKCDVENGFFYFTNRIGTSSFTGSNTEAYDIILDATTDDGPHITVNKYANGTYSTGYDYSFPSKSGTLALVSDISSSIAGNYLPLAGGTLKGDLYFSSSIYTIGKVNGSNPKIYATEMHSSGPISTEFSNAKSTSLSTLLSGSESIGLLELYNTDSLNSTSAVSTIRPQSHITSDVTLYLPSKSGTLALLSDISSSGNYLPLGGGTVTGRITRSSGGAWISQRDLAVVYQSYTDNSSANPVAAVKTPSGAWAMGSLAGTESLCFSYSTDTDYSAGNNSANVVYLPTTSGTIALTSNLSSYLPLSGGILSGSNQTPLIINGVANNEASITYRYLGDTNTDWTVGPGAGAADMTYWGFYRAGVGRVTCISSSGDIDTNGHLQSSGLINTYSEYQSYKGSGCVDWRFGSATGSGDNTWFGLYNNSSGSILQIHSAGTIRSVGEIVSTSANAFRAVQGNYGMIFRNDGTNCYIMPTNSGDPYGSWNDKYMIISLDNNQWQFIRSEYDNGMPTPRGYAILAATNDERVYSLGNSGSTYMKVRCSIATYHCAYTNSDIRLKENIKDTEINALDLINKIKIRQFDWKEDHRHQNIGFVADELEELDENLSEGGGYEDEEEKTMDVKSVNTFYLQGYEVKAIQELSLENKQLREMISQLKDEIAEIKKALK